MTPDAKPVVPKFKVRLLFGGHRVELVPEVSRGTNAQAAVKVNLPEATAACRRAMAEAVGSGKLDIGYDPEAVPPAVSRFASGDEKRIVIAVTPAKKAEKPSEPEK